MITVLTQGLTRKKCILIEKHSATLIFVQLLLA